MTAVMLNISDLEIHSFINQVFKGPDPLSLRHIYESRFNMTKKEEKQGQFLTSFLTGFADIRPTDTNRCV